MSSKSIKADGIRALIFFAALAWALPARAELHNPATDFMAGNYGVGFHYLKGNLTGESADWNATVQSFDAPKFAAAVAQTGAKWCLITLGQNSGYYCAPNAVLDKYSGYKAGERNSTRDLPMDIAAALAPYNIRLFFYLPSSVPDGDTKIATAFGLTKKDSTGNYMITPDFPPKWGEVIKEWSTRYGDKLWGWWFDGFYTRVNFTDSMGRYYSDAVKAGNPQAVLSLAPGTKGIERYKVRSRWSDYFAGEQNAKNTLDPCAGRWFTGLDSIGPVQWQTFSVLGKGWWTDGLQYTDSEYVVFSNKTFAAGGAITWDLVVSANGTVSAVQLDQMVKNRAQIKTVTRIAPWSGPGGQGFGRPAGSSRNVLRWTGFGDRDQGNSDATGAIFNPLGRSLQFKRAIAETPVILVP